MPFNAIRENKILTKISKFTVSRKFSPKFPNLQYQGLSVMLTLIRPIFVLKKLSTVYICCIFSNALHTTCTFIMEANTLHTDETASKTAV